MGVGHSQISDHDVHGGRRVIRYNRYVPAGFMTSLSELPNGMSLHRQICPWQLHKRAGDETHRESKEKRVTLFTPSMDVGHEAGLVYAWRERVDKVEEQGDDQHDRVSWGDIFQAMRAVERR